MRFSCPPQFSITEHPAENAVALVLAGELDLATAPDLQSRVAAAGDIAVILDLGQLQFIDSTGLRVLWTACQDASCDGRSLSLLPGPPHVQRVFATAGMLERLPFRKLAPPGEARGERRTKHERQLQQATDAARRLSRRRDGDDGPIGNGPEPRFAYLTTSHD